MKRCDRDRNGGGVAVYLKDTLLDKYTVREDVPKSFLELLCVEVKPVRAAPFLVMAWYRPPNVTADTFDLLENCLQFLDREDKEIILLGDTNCDILAKYSKTGHASTIDDLPAHSLHLLEIYNLFGLHQTIESPSRETLTTTTLIDHIATTNKSKIVTYGVHKTSLSDHYLQGRRERGRAPGQLVDAGPLLDSFNFQLNFIRKIQIVTIEIKSVRI